MILKRGVKVQLVVFALITVLGISYTAVRYIGIGRGVLNRGYVAYVDLTDSGGIFTNAEVTYRGVTVGRVGPIELTRDGLRVRLNLDRGHHIPRDSMAVVANRSAVGEQYIDLRPRSDGAPYLDSGAPYTIPRQDTKVPVRTEELLGNLDKLVASVDTEDLAVVVDELDRAFAGSAADLQAILDSSDRLLQEANDSFPAASDLLDNSRVVLDTQRDEGANIRAFARNLSVLTDELRRDDPNLRDVIDSTVPATTQADRLIDQLSPTLPVLLANLTSTGQVIASRIDGLRSLLILYPATLAGGFTVTPGDGTEHFGLVLNLNSPPPCTKGYEKTDIRYPQDTSDVPAEPNVGCKLPRDSQQDVRGARNAPPPRPAPSVPPGATDGAGEPPGGASGEASAQAAGDERRSPRAGDQTEGQAAGQPAGQASDQAGDQAAAGTPFAPFSSATQDFSPNSILMSGYDPVTGAVIGSNGQRYGIGTTGGQQRLLGDASWKWLLLGPLAR
ncbi:MAG TPA: MlaD family protein [Streptosporangiaceae bacterium]|nr:MlaD family protein [Streptosporangiaceae bacterium]